MSGKVKPDDQVQQNFFNKMAARSFGTMRAFSGMERAPDIRMSRLLSTEDLRIKYIEALENNKINLALLFLSQIFDQFDGAEPDKALKDKAVIEKSLVKLFELQVGEKRLPTYRELREVSKLIYNYLNVYFKYTAKKGWDLVDEGDIQKRAFAEIVGGLYQEAEGQEIEKVDPHGQS